MRKISFAALFILPVLILLPHLGQFPFQPGATFSDLLISHFPNAIYIQRALQIWKTIPLWSDTILSGYPFAANPLSSLFYLPGLLALVFPLPLGFNLLVILHLIFGGVGMYYLLRAEGLEEGALLGALAFEAMPKLFGHLAAGHLTLIYAVTWTPWLLYVERRGFPDRRSGWALTGVVLGIICLVDVRWAAYAGLLWLFYSLRLVDWRSIRGWVGRWIFNRAVNVIFAALVAAPLLLPLIQYTRLSTRSQLTAQENLLMSLPPGQLMGLVYPNIAGLGEWMLYPGAVGLLLTLYTLCVPSTRRKAAFWLGVIGISLLFALGSYLPGLSLVARLPGLDLLRVPPRVLFLTGMGFAAVSGYGLQSLVARISERTRPARDMTGPLLFGAAAFIILLAAAVWTVVDRPLTRIQFTWGAAFTLIVVTGILLALNQRITAGGLVVLLLSACLVDLSGVNGLSLDFRSPQTVFSQGQAVANYLKAREGQLPFRVYSPSYSLPQQTAALQGIELADGVDPLQLAAYVQYMLPATGVPEQGYSVTLPPYRNADPATDNRDFQPNAARLGLLNVKYILSAFPLPESGMTLLDTIGSTLIYENPDVLPRAWVQAPDAAVGQAILSVPSLQEQPNSVKINAVGPGLLVLSELAYPGWQVTVDGHAAPISTAAGLLRAVTLSSGTHEVVFRFCPLALYLGLVLALVAWLALGVLMFSGRTRHA